VLGFIDIKSERMDERARRLKKVRVVGVTCIASVFPVLNDNVFPIVILDECSQMIEPLSLLPIARFKCEKLVRLPCLSTLSFHYILSH
jgi:superfamily I DNA and/or RNA helicase